MYSFFGQMSWYLLRLFQSISALPVRRGLIQHCCSEKNCGWYRWLAVFRRGSGNSSLRCKVPPISFSVNRWIYSWFLFRNRKGEGYIFRFLSRVVVSPATGYNRAGYVHPKGSAGWHCNSAPAQMIARGVRKHPDNYRKRFYFLNRTRRRLLSGKLNKR